MRENIVFGGRWDAEAYARALAAAALEPDLAALAAGDATIVGEAGVALSGLARKTGEARDAPRTVV